MHDFDEELDRVPHDCVKWSYLDACRAPGSVFPEGVLPLWVADMDLASPPAVVEAIRERAAHPVYGYAGLPDAYHDAFIGWMRTRHGTAVERDWIRFSPGIVPAIGTAIRAYTEPGDGVVIMPPVYHPFRQLAERNGRRVLEAPLAFRDGRWEMDLEAVDRACADARLLVFCSPHNPVGRVWTRPELDALAEIVLRRGLVLVSDEIHADLVYAPHRHVPALGLSPGLDRVTVSCWAPSKTFNIAGLQTSYIVIPDPELRARFTGQNEAAGLGTPNCMGVAAAVAAYREGGPWLDEALDYLRGNHDYLVEELGRRVPALRVHPCEGTFLAWIDFRGAGLSGDVKDALLDRAGLWLDPGTRFGAGGEGFARLNFGCTRATLSKAVDRLARAFG